MQTCYSLRQKAAAEIRAHVATVPVTAQLLLIHSENSNNEAGCAHRNALRNTNGLAEESPYCPSTVCVCECVWIWLCLLVYKWVVAGFPEESLNVAAPVSSVAEEGLPGTEPCVSGERHHTCHFLSAVLPFFVFCLLFLRPNWTVFRAFVCPPSRVHSWESKWECVVTQVMDLSSAPIHDSWFMVSHNEPSAQIFLEGNWKCHHKLSGTQKILFFEFLKVANYSQKIMNDWESWENVPQVRTRPVRKQWCNAGFFSSRVPHGGFFVVVSLKRFSMVCFTDHQQVLFPACVVRCRRKVQTFPAATWSVAETIAPQFSGAKKKKNL